MDFSLEYTEEQEEFAKEVRQWLNENVPKDWVRVRDPDKRSDEQWQRARELGRKLAEKGWLAPGMPRKYGGGELDVDHQFVLSQEFEEAKIGFPPYYDSGLSLACNAIMVCGTEEQKERHLPLICKGEVVTHELFTEPEVGTDEASQQATALRHEREGEYFIINGQKIFVGSTYVPADRYLLLTKSDLEAPRHGNLAMFFAPSDLPGITSQPLDLFTRGEFGMISGPTTDGSHGRKNTVFFDDVRIHEDYLIGEDHDGWKVSEATLNVEHGGGGVARPPHENFLIKTFLSYCKSNPNVVKRLRENPQLLDSVVEVYIGTQIQRLWATRNFWAAATRTRAPGAGNQLGMYSKYFAGRAAFHMARVLGPYAFLSADDERCLEEGMFELGERGACLLAPGGTPEAGKIILSRALRIGR
ncbi:putative acyl-CoA dehydrogenase FadE17 [subsurface metagenome]